MNFLKVDIKIITFKEFDVLNATASDWTIYHEFRHAFNSEEYPEDKLISDSSFEKLLKGYVMRGEMKFCFFNIFDDKKQIGVFSYFSYDEDSPSFKNNEKLVTFDIKLLKDYRYKGIGTCVLKIIVDQNEQTNKSVFKTKYDIPETKKFVSRFNAKQALVYYDNELNMKSVDKRKLQDWIKEASKLNVDIKVVIIEGKIPDTYIDEFVKCYTDSINSQPRDGLEKGDEVITVEQYRKDEEIDLSQGNKIISALALKSNGIIIGLTQIKFLDSNGENLEQGITGVSDLNRGRKLGKWLKAEILLYIKKYYPLTKTIHTRNTSSNEAMNHINTILGFKTIRKTTVVQVQIDDLKKFLQTKNIVHKNYSLKFKSNNP